MKATIHGFDFTPALNWLLEPDLENPSVRYLTLRDLLGATDQDIDLQRARKALMANGPVPVILAAQNADGSWTPRSGIFQVSDMQLIILAEMGVDERDERVQRACEYALTHYVAENGAFAERLPALNNETYHCKNGLMCYALTRLGFKNDARVERALSWQAQAVSGDWAGGRNFEENGTCGPDFACRENDGLPCAWGAIKAARAFQAVADERKTQPLREALDKTIQFLLSFDIEKAAYPRQGRVSPMWFRFGFPFNDWSDLLELCQVLADQDLGQDARLRLAIERVLDMHDATGRWKMGRSLNGMMWTDIERKGQPSKWITLRALRMLKTAGWLELE